MEWRPQRHTRALLEQVDAVLEDYAEQLPVTVRQVFYRLVAGGYPKDENAYARLCETLVRARRAKRIPFDALRDDGVTLNERLTFGGIEDFWDDVVRQMRCYTLDKQGNQEVYVELWCEAAGMVPQLSRAAHPFSVPVFSCGGFLSLSAVRIVVDRVLSRGVPTVLLHVGDFDPSGESIYDALIDDVIAFLRDDAPLPGIHRLVPVRAALTREQVAEFDLPTAPAKPSDARSRNWTGGTCQLEALPPDVLAEVVRDAILEHLDLDRMLGLRLQEKAERQILLRQLPRGAE